MCAPLLAVAGAALSIAQGVAGFGAAQQQADEQNARYMANAREAQRAAVQSYGNQQIRADQERTSAGQQLFQQNIEALEKRGTAFAAAAEAGVSGLSVDSLTQTVTAQQGRRADVLGQQLSANLAAIRSNMDDTRASAQARINSVARAENPSPLPFIIQGMSGAVGSLGRLAIPGASVA